MKYEFELAAAAYKLMHDLFRVQPGETVAITLDTTSSDEVANAIAQAAVILGGKPFVIKQPAPRGGGMVGDQDMAVNSLTAAIKNADMWVECNQEPMLYSTVHFNAIYADPDHRPRYICLAGVTPDLLMRNVGKADFSTLTPFIKAIGKATEEGKKFHITSPAGTDIAFANYPGRPASIQTAELHIKNAKSMMPGQISWSPRHETINGKLVVDGSFVPLGLLKNPITLMLEKGYIVKISGDGSEAKAFENWLRSFNDPMMFHCAHLAYGFGPYAVLTGNVLEDERVWGCTEWGFGNMGPKVGVPEGFPAASHTDGICLNCSLWMDGVQVLDKGTVVGPTPEIVELAGKAKPV